MLTSETNKPLYHPKIMPHILYPINAFHMEKSP